MTQLNFLGNYLENKDNAQLELFTQELEPAGISRKPKYDKVEKFFCGLNRVEIDEYRAYWESVTPTNKSELFKRWLFAFMSVHTSYKSNVTGYNAIKDWEDWIVDRPKLGKLIKDSGVGLHNNRLKFISKFADDFWDNTKEFTKSSEENWTSYRNRLMKRVLGLGPAKTSFSLEMCFPNEAFITCLDTHLFQAYGLDQAKDLRQYDKIEQHWLDMSRMWNIPPYIARCIFWDKKQGKTDSRYWSYILE
jgi:hypothetical protein